MDACQYLDGRISVWKKVELRLTNKAVMTKNV